MVRHGSGWTGAAMLRRFFSPFFWGTGRDNRVYASDSSGHATLWGGGTRNSQPRGGGWEFGHQYMGTANGITGSDQHPGYFDFAMSSSGAAIAFYWVNPLMEREHHLARCGSSRGGMPWHAPATAGTTFDAGGLRKALPSTARAKRPLFFTDTALTF